MADVTNVVLGMHLGRPMPAGQTCDLCDDPATVRIMGERDSWGAEWNDWCDPHYRALMEFGVTFAYCAGDDFDCGRWVPLADDDERAFCHVHRAEATPA
jgi:hypothetical protein